MDRQPKGKTVENPLAKYPIHRFANNSSRGPG